MSSRMKDHRKPKAESYKDTWFWLEDNWDFLLGESEPEETELRKQEKRDSERIILDRQRKKALLQEDFIRLGWEYMEGMTPEEINSLRGLSWEEITKRLPLTQEKCRCIRKALAADVRDTNEQYNKEGE